MANVDHDPELGFGRRMSDLVGVFRPRGLNLASKRFGFGPYVSAGSNAVTKFIDPQRF
jgi:hypothetical protein